MKLPVLWRLIVIRMDLHIKHRLRILLIENNDYSTPYKIPVEWYLHRWNFISVSRKIPLSTIIMNAVLTSIIAIVRFTSFVFLLLLFSSSLLSVQAFSSSFIELTAYWENEATAQTSYDVLIISSNWCIILSNKSFLRLVNPLKMQTQITNGIFMNRINCSSIVEYQKRISIKLILYPVCANIPTTTKKTPDTVSFILSIPNWYANAEHSQLEIFAIFQQ